MSSTVRDVTDADFQTAVLERSRSVPVLVDFWAPWCGPCRVLGPVLEKVAGDYAGRVEVVKLETDGNPETARRYRISSIPAVKLFRDGEVAGEFVGALPEARVRAFLDQHCPSALDEALASARQALAVRDLEKADAHIGDVLAARSDHPVALVLAARVALARGQLADTIAIANRVSSQEPRDVEEAAAIRALAELAQAGAAGLEATAAAAAQAPDDLAARYAHAGALVMANRWSEALDELLAIVERNKRWNDEAARKAMLTVFNALGVQHPLSSEYRRKLMILL